MIALIITLFVLAMVFLIFTLVVIYSDAEDKGFTAGLCGILLTIASVLLVTAGGELQTASTRTDLEKMGIIKVVLVDNEVKYYYPHPEYYELFRRSMTEEDQKFYETAIIELEEDPYKYLFDN